MNQIYIRSACLSYGHHLVPQVSANLREEWGSHAQCLACAKGQEGFVSVCFIQYIICCGYTVSSKGVFSFFLCEQGKLDLWILHTSDQSIQYRQIAIINLSWDSFCQL